MSAHEQLGDGMTLADLYGIAPLVPDPELFAELPLKRYPDQWQPSEDYPTPQSVPKDEFGKIVHDALNFSPEPAYWRAGDPNLPVSVYRQHNVDLLNRYNRLIISSPTGSGKSTQEGLIALEAGAERVFISEPRIIATVELADRARWTLGPKYANLVGNLSGNKADSNCPDSARLVYVTEHLLFKMMNRGEIGAGDVIIDDEAHEGTAPTDFVLGLTKELQQDIPDLRLIISSATINTEEFARWAADPYGVAAPVLSLPGRTYGLTKLISDETVVDAMRRYMKEGNVLTFEPGVRDIKSTQVKAQSRQKDAVVHTLYGDQSPLEQKAALTDEDGHHIVASRVAETSLTPNNKQIVIDGGLSNVGRYRAGVRGIETVFSSKGTMEQRGGRVGRVEPGLHVIAQPENSPPSPDWDDRQDYDDPAIQHSSVAPFIAEFLRNGRFIEEFDLPHSPAAENLAHDYKILQRLGATAMVDGVLTLTPVGEAMTDLPLDAATARMVVESRRMELPEGVGRQSLELQVAAVAATLQVNGILDGGQYSGRRYLKHLSSREPFSTEQLSDVLFELDTFVALFAKQQELKDQGREGEVAFDRFLVINDILPNRYYKAVRSFDELCVRLDLDPLQLQKPVDEARAAILRCQLAGTDELFVPHGRRTLKDIRGDRRTMGRKSTLAIPATELVMGSPFDYTGMRATGTFSKRFVTAASGVTLELVREVVPHRVTDRSEGYVVSRNGKLVEKRTHFFDGSLHIGTSESALPPTEETRKAIISAMMTGAAKSAVNPNDKVPFKPGTPNATAAIGRWLEAQRLENRTGVKLNIDNRYQQLIRKVIEKSLDSVPLEVVEPEMLDHLIPQVFLSSLVRPSRRRHLPEIIKRSPDGISIPIGEESKEYIPITYRHNIAYITLTRAQSYQVSREHFASLLENHDIKLRVGNGKYHHFDTAFTHIDDARATKAKKDARREIAREVQVVEQDVTKAPTPERERAPIMVEPPARIKGINMRAYRRKLRRNMRQQLSRGKGASDND